MECLPCDLAAIERPKKLLEHLDWHLCLDDQFFAPRARRGFRDKKSCRRCETLAAMGLEINNVVDSVRPSPPWR